MGLDCSHDAWHGAYSAFHRFRQAVAKAAGGRFCEAPDTTTFEIDDKWEGLFILLAHSDCDGEISPEDCVKVADDLEKLLPALEPMGMGGGHIEGYGGYAAVARRFIDGCRAAAAAGEPLDFH